MAHYITSITALNFAYNKILPESGVVYHVDGLDLASISQTYNMVDGKLIDDADNVYVPVHTFDIDPDSKGIRKVYDGGTIESHLERSSFTIEAVAYNVEEGTVVELYDAMSDYNDAILKACNPDELTWTDLLHMAVLSCGTNEDWVIDDETFVKLGKVVSNRWNMPQFKVIKKFVCSALDATYSHQFIRTLKMCGALGAIFPEITDPIVLDLLLLKLKELSHCRKVDKVDVILQTIPVPDIGVVCSKYNVDETAPIIAVLRHELDHLRNLKSSDIRDTVGEVLIPFFISLKRNGFDLDMIISNTDDIREKVVKSMELYYSINFTTLKDDERTLTKERLRKCLFGKQVSAISKIWES